MDAPIANASGARAGPPLVSLSLASAAALSYQILLLRLFSIIQWHHFAYMVISLALLGYGASGTFLTLARQRLSGNLPAAYVLGIGLFALSCLPAFLLAQHLAFSPEELLWRPHLIWRLGALYLVLGLPFFFIACAVGLVLMGWGRLAGRVYAVDLIGAAAGAAAVVAALWVMTPTVALSAVTALGLLATLIATWETGHGGWPWTLAVILAVVVSTFAAADLRPHLALSAYKDLSQALQIAGARVETTRSGPHGLVTVVANTTVPIRDAPGLSLHNASEPPEQKALFVDGNQTSSITRGDGTAADLAFLAAMPSALPYRLQRAGRVLILDAGGGLLALQARYFGASDITAVESNPEVLDLVRDDYDRFSGGLYTGADIRAERANARAFVTATGETYDLIQVPATGALGGGAAGLFALSEDYLRTREAVATLFSRLAPDGLLVMHAWMQLPPRDSLRLAATLIDALNSQGIAAPGKQMMALRGWQMATLVVKNGRFSPVQIETLAQFADQHGFDLAWYPGMQASEANRINRLTQPYLHEAISAFVAGDGEAYTRGYKFDLTPTADRRPFFHNFLRWRTLPEVLPLLRRGGMPLLESGYVLLLAALAQAIVLGLVLIVLPLAAGAPRRSLREAPATSRRTIVYFLAIGLGFMFIELAAIHQFLLYLEEPIYATALVLTAFLAFAGIGSYASSRFAELIGERQTSRLAALMVIALCVAGALFLDQLLTLSAAAPLPVKVGVSLLVIAPLAFAMGQMFPTAITALDALASRRATLVPWAWAVNGCASVVGAVLATVLALAVGFDGCLLAAVVTYALALLSFPR
ncbi:MAG: SAM-dependent methyltransferase [Gammaproteobacteria bacterium]